MISIRVGTASDIERVNEYYNSHQRSSDASASDFLLLAEDDNQVVGVVRLCFEERYHLLRGMYLTAAYRGQGIGSQMLHQLAKYIGNQDCYCLPWAHLESFYRIIGFETMTNEDLPGFLQERLTKYRQDMEHANTQQRMQDDLGVFPEGGLTYIGMKRPKSKFLVCE